MKWLHRIQLLGVAESWLMEYLLCHDTSLSIAQPTDASCVRKGQCPPHQSSPQHTRRLPFLQLWILHRSSLCMTTPCVTAALPHNMSFSPTTASAGPYHWDSGADHRSLPLVWLCPLLAHVFQLLLRHLAAAARPAGAVCCSWRLEWPPESWWAGDCAEEGIPS